MDIKINSISFIVIIENKYLSVSLIKYDRTYILKGMSFSFFIDEKNHFASWGKCSTYVCTRGAVFCEKIHKIYFVNRSMET